MSLQNTAASYQIVIQKVGSAMPAVQEMDQMAAATAKAAVAGRATTQQLVAMKEASLLTRESFRTLHATSALLGGHFLEVSLAGQAAVDSMKLLRGAAKATDTDMKTMGVGLVGVGAAVAMVTTAWQAMTARMQANHSVLDLGEAMNKQAAAAQKSLNLLREQGKIGEDQWMRLNNQLAESIGNYDKQKAAIAAIRAVDPSKAQTEDEQKLSELRKELDAETLDGYRKETFAATELYLKRKKQIDDLYNDMLRFNGGKKDTGTMAVDQALNDRALAAVTGRIDATRQMAELEKTLEFVSLNGSDDRVKQAEYEFNQRLALYQHLAEVYPSLEEQMTQAEQDASLKRLQIIQAEQDKVRLHIKTTGEMVKETEEQFASGMASAITDFVSGTKKAKDAWRDFARSFLQAISNMILQTEILAAIKAISGFASSGSSSYPSEAWYGGAAMAGGGVRYAANGIQAVSQPTYFPKFNVLAGEAGREMLTVLARPRMMAIGGMQAVVGQAAGHTLAITSANDLARHGGRIEIELSHSEMSEARIVSNSIKGAEVHLTKKVQQPSQFRSAIKKSVTT